MPPTATKSAKPLSVIPASEIVYTEKLQSGLKREYYDSAHSDVGSHRYDVDFEHMVPTTWKIGVGDLIAVQCKQSLPPKRKPLARKGIWYPFTKAWSPGQVIAIYQDKAAKKRGEQHTAMTMQIRWLYRRGDFEQVDEDGNFLRQLRGEDHHPDMVYETDSTDELPVHDAMGKIVLTAFKHNSLQGKYFDRRTGMPQMTFVCRYRVAAGDKIERTLDWDAYHDWKPGLYLPEPIFRGLRCELSLAHRKKGLENALLNAGVERWKAEYVPHTAENAVDITGGTPGRLLQKTGRKVDDSKPAAKERVSAKKELTTDKKKSDAPSVQESSKRKGRAPKAKAPTAEEEKKPAAKKRKDVEIQASDAAIRPAKRASLGSSQTKGGSEESKLEAHPTQRKRAATQTLRKSSDEALTRAAKEAQGVPKHGDKAKDTVTTKKRVKRDKSSRPSKEKSDKPSLTEGAERDYSEKKVDERVATKGGAVDEATVATRVTRSADHVPTAEQAKAKDMKSTSKASSRSAAKRDKNGKSSATTAPRRATRVADKDSVNLPPKNIIVVEPVTTPEGVIRSLAKGSMSKRGPPDDLAPRAIGYAAHDSVARTTQNKEDAKETKRKSGTTAKSKVQERAASADKGGRRAASYEAHVATSTTSRNPETLEQEAALKTANQAKAAPPTIAKKPDSRSGRKGRASSSKGKAGNGLTTKQSLDHKPDKPAHAAANDAVESKASSKAKYGVDRSANKEYDRKANSRKDKSEVEESQQVHAEAFARESGPSIPQSSDNCEKDSSAKGVQSSTKDTMDVEPTSSASDAPRKKRKKSSLDAEPVGNEKKKRATKRFGRNANAPTDRPLVNFGAQTDDDDREAAPVESEADNDERPDATPAVANESTVRTALTAVAKPTESTRKHDDNVGRVAAFQSGDGQESKSTDEPPPSEMPAAPPAAARVQGKVSSEANLLCIKKMGKKHRNYVSSTSLEVRTINCAPGALPKEGAKGDSWTLHVGDIVCVECAEAGDQADHILQRHNHLPLDEASRKWFPFNIPWSYCQVLSIYSDVDQNGTTGERMIELRWFYRKSELQLSADDVKGMEEFDDSIEELIESKHVNFKDWGASLVLGRVDVYFGDHDHMHTTMDNADRSSDNAPAVQCRCRCYGEVDEIPNRLRHGSNNGPEVWYRYMIERSLEVSKHMMASKKLKKATSAFLLSKEEVSTTPRKYVASVTRQPRLPTQGKSKSEENASDRPFVHFGSQIDDDDQEEAPFESAEININGKKTDSSSEVTNESTVLSGFTVVAKPTESTRNHDDAGGRISGGQLKDDQESKSIDGPPAAKTPTAPAGVTSEQAKASLEATLLCSKKMGKKHRNYSSSVSVEVRTGNCAQGALTKEAMKGGTWTLRVGDIVCVECAEAGDQAEHILRRNKGRSLNEASRKWFPFTIPWSYCQVLSIYSDTYESGATGETMIEIRWFYRKSELQLTEDVEKKMTIEFDDRIEELIESNHVNYKDWAVSHVLGRVDVFFGNHDHDRNLKENSPFPSDGVPAVPCRCRYYGEIREIPKRLLVYPNELDVWYTQLAKRSLDLSKHMRFSRKLKDSTSGLLLSPEEVTRRTVHQKCVEPSGMTRSEDKASQGVYGDSAQSAAECEGGIDFHGGDDLPCADDNDAGQLTETKEDRVGLREADIYHCDVSSRRSYYREIHVIPPYEHYASGLFNGGEKHGGVSNEGCKDHWGVRMGDTAVVHWAGESRYPFNVPWAVCEIVTIWREHGSTEEVENMKNKLEIGTLDNELQYPVCQESIMLEIRWLYRKDELPGSYASSTSASTDDTELDEVLETDHFDDCDATSLLAPVKLHSKSVVEEKSLPILGMPVLDYYCRRFWSIHRKSLVPSGSLDAMTDRGRMYSSHLGKNQVLRAALNFRKDDDGEDAASANDSQSPSSPSLAFREVIKRLSLIDASETTDVHGLKLIGREREQDKIMTFLRSAIRGIDDANREKKSSLFIAGPPGTGKTASVKSAVERLRHEQANGDIPEFHFVYLNGMEMRHPFETYVKLWEAISDPARDKNCATKKDKRTPGNAAHLLERWFTQSRPTDSEFQHYPVTVLLLDEIDYLLTRKQTVLYNLFDWPVRTATRQDGPRLVVVGISNTLNLPDRLKPSVRSRLGGERCDFSSYKVDEMVQILKMKIAPNDVGGSRATPVFDDDAIMFAARKTGALSGDVRKALQMCKSAAENVLAELEDKEQEGTRRMVVSIRDVQNVSRQSFSSILSKAVSMSTPFEALLLVALASLSMASGKEKGEFDIKEVMTKMESAAARSGDLQYMPPPTFDETLDMLTNLGEGQLISLRTPKNSNSPWPLISLPMESTTVLSALSDSPHKQLAEKILGTLRPW